MNGKNGNNRTKILFVDLLEYIAKYQYARYIFSSHYNDECLNENVNKHTLRMNLVFKEMSIKFNPNQILLYNFMDFKSTDSQYVILDRVKYARIKEMATGIKIDFVSGNLLDDIDNHTYTVFAEFVTR